MNGTKQSKLKRINKIIHELDSREIQAKEANAANVQSRVVVPSAGTKPKAIPKPMQRASLSGVMPIFKNAINFFLCFHPFPCLIEIKIHR